MMNDDRAPARPDRPRGDESATDRKRPGSTSGTENYGATKEQAKDGARGDDQADPKH